MPLPLLTTLSLRARQAYPIIQRGVRLGLASRAIASTLQAAELGIQRASMLTIIRAEKAALKKSANLKFLPFNRRPNPALLPEALTIQRRRYSYKIAITGINPNTGEAMLQNITVATDKLITRGAAETIAAGYIEDDPRGYGIDVERVQLIGVQRAGTLGQLL